MSITDRISNETEAHLKELENSPCERILVLLIRKGPWLICQCVALYLFTQFLDITTNSVRAFDIVIYSLLFCIAILMYTFHILYEIIRASLQCFKGLYE